LQVVVALFHLFEAVKHVRPPASEKVN